MTIELKSYLIAAAIVCFLIFSWVGCLMVGEVHGQRRALELVKSKSDTLEFRDTVWLPAPEPVKTEPAGYELVKVGTVAQLKRRIATLESEALAQLPDTARAEAPAAADTAAVTIPIERERKTYETEDYRAVVSGIMPSLDEMAVFPKTVQITTTNTVKKRWTAAVTAGPGMVYDGKVHFGVGVVVGLSYNF